MSPIRRRPDFDRVAALHDERVAGTAPDYARSVRLVNALREEAIALGRWHREDPLGDLSHKIRLARALAAVRRV